MRYLIYFDMKGLSEIIKDFEFKTPAFLHSTLYVFHMDPEQEQSLIDELSRISFRPFDIEAHSFARFSKNLLVLRLTRPDELLSVHKNILAVAMAYAEPDFAERIKHQFGDGYVPHITLSRKARGIRKPEMIECKECISEFVLAKKMPQGYEVMQRFKAQ